MNHNSCDVISTAISNIYIHNHQPSITPFSSYSSLSSSTLKLSPKNSIKFHFNPKFIKPKLSQPSYLSSSSTVPSRDRIIDFGKHRGKMMGTLPSNYLKWVSKNLRAGDFEEWAKLSDDVLEDPVYKDRIEWEFAEKVLNGDVLGSSNGNAVDELLALSERFGWDNDDKLGWSKIDFGLLGTSKGGRIPTLGVESTKQFVEKMEYGKRISSSEKKHGDGNGGEERRKARRERLKLRTKKMEEDSDGGRVLVGFDEKQIDSDDQTTAVMMSGGNGDSSSRFPGRQSLMKKAISHKKFVR